MPRETSRDIDAAAARWAARIEGGAMSEEDDRVLDEWLAQDSRRIGALSKAQAVVALSYRARALDAALDPELRRSPHVNRRAMLAAGVGGLAAVGLGYGVLRTRQAPQVVETALGETRIVSLSDGSVMTLNTLTRVSLRMTEALRDVRLLAGEAIFDIVGDSARPFIISAKEAQVEAWQASLVVKALTSAPVEVLVRAGQAIAGAGQSRILLEANTRSTFRGGDAIEATVLRPVEIEDSLVWREGRVKFEDISLGQAAAEFRRYSDIEMVVPASVANLRINGLFVANDPVSFAKAAAATLEIGVTIQGGTILFAA